MPKTRTALSALLGLALAACRQSPEPPPAALAPEPEPPKTSGVQLLTDPYILKRPLEPTDSWLGFYKTGPGSYRFSVPKLSSKKEEIYPDDGLDDIMISEPAEGLIFLVKGCARCKEGEVATALYATQVSSGAPARIQLEGKEYVLSASWDGREGSIYRGFQLVLEGRGLRQTLFENIGPLDLPYVSWAGDLDGDRELDLLLTWSPGDGISSYLYLSSLADPGEVTHQAADHFFPNG